MKNKLKNAFSLIEVIWGVLILSIIIVTVTGIFTGIMVSTKKSKKFVIATNLAQKQLEYIKLTVSSDIPGGDLDLDGRKAGVTGISFNSTYFPSYPQIQPAPLKETVDGVAYYYRIEKNNRGSSGDLVNIKVTVYWELSDNEGKNSVALETFKGR